MKTFFFIRHGQTEWNAIERMQGQWNSDLNDLGRKQAHILGQLLANFDVHALYASPLDRACQTAEIINRYLGLQIELDHRIKEWDSGDWSGCLYSDVKANWPEEWAALEADRFNYRGPGCENYPDMIGRSAGFLDELNTNSSQNIAIVSHGMIGRAMISQLLGLDAAETLKIRQPNDVVFRIESNNGTSRVDQFVGNEGPLTGLYLT